MPSAPCSAAYGWPRALDSAHPRPTPGSTCSLSLFQLTLKSLSPCSGSLLLTHICCIPQLSYLAVSFHLLWKCRLGQLVSHLGKTLTKLSSPRIWFSGLQVPGPRVNPVPKESHQNAEHSTQPWMPAEDSCCSQFLEIVCLLKGQDARSVPSHEITSKPCFLDFFLLDSPLLQRQFIYRLTIYI